MAWTLRSPRARLRAVETELAGRKRLQEEQLRPVALPRGSRAGFTRVSTESYPPALVVDLWVEDAAGSPIPGLQPKDFRIVIGGRPIAHVEAGADRGRRALPLRGPGAGHLPIDGGGPPGGGEAGHGRLPRGLRGPQAGGTDPGFQ